MKRLTLSLIVSAVTISAASAHKSINTGYYLGAALGYSATTGKATFQNAGVLTTGSADVGSNSGNFGIHGGYGWVTRCLYVGGEIAYTFENTRVNNTTGQGPGTNQMQLKRNGYFNIALRGGWLFSPSTMGYIRLGINWGKYTLNDTLSVFNNNNPGSGSKNRLSFAPGVGIETAIHRNIYLRIEYVYEFGPSVTARNSNVPGSFAQVSRIRTQSGKLGLSYKF